MFHRLADSQEYRIVERVWSQAFEGAVFNFAVDEDESYVVSGIGSKNCRCISEVIFEDEYEALTRGA